MGAELPNLPLRVHWPPRLALPDCGSDAPAQLLGRRLPGDPPELVVAAATAAAAAGGQSVGVLLRSCSVADAACDSDTPQFVLRPAKRPGGQLPIPLRVTPAGERAPAAERRTTRAQQRRQLEEQEQQPEWQCQIVLHSHLTHPGRSSSSSGPWASAAWRRAGPLAARLLACLLACLLAAHWQGLADLGSRGGACLADLAARHLLWLMTAQPAGEGKGRAAVLGPTLCCPMPLSRCCAAGPQA